MKKKIDYKKYIYKPYYYVPPCPSCNSKITGRFIKLHRVTETDWMINESLRNGELVSAQPELPEEVNVFCVECGYTWYTDIKLKFISLRQIAEEKMNRCTNDILCERLGNEMTEEKEKRNKHGFIYNSVTKFVGKV